MLLRRIIEHVKTQNWTAIALDFVIVVVGVFVGIQVSNWNEDRIRRERQTEIAVRMSSELDEMIGALGARIAVHRQTVDGIDIMISALERGVLSDDDRPAFELGLQMLDMHWQPPWHLATLDELISNGELDLIADADLRYDLVGFKDTTETIRNDFMHIRILLTSYTPTVHKYASFSTPLAEKRVAAEDDPAFVTSMARLADYDFSAMIADDAYAPALGQVRRLQGAFLLNHRVILEQAQSLRSRMTIGD